MRVRKMPNGTIKVFQESGPMRTDEAYIIQVVNGRASISPPLVSRVGVDQLRRLAREYDHVADLAEQAERALLTT